MLIIQQKPFEFLPLITQLILILLEKIALGTYPEMKNPVVSIGGQCKFPRSYLRSARLRRQTFMFLFCLLCIIKVCPTSSADLYVFVLSFVYY